MKSSKLKQKRAAAKKGTTPHPLEVVRHAVGQLVEIEAELKTSTVSHCRARLQEVTGQLNELLEASS